MSARIIDGKAFAGSLGEKIAGSIAALIAQSGAQPGLAVVLVGSDPASEIYVRSKGGMARQLGLASFEHVLPADSSQERLLAVIPARNADDGVDGILVQLPLPAHRDSLAVIEPIEPAEDVDGLHRSSAGRLASDLPGLVSCTPLGCLMLLRSTLGNLSGLDAIVVGSSILVGKPIAQLLLAENCTVTMAHSRTRDLAGKVRQADIVVAAVGPGADDPGRLDQAGRHRDRCGHEPDAAGRQDGAGGRCRVRRRLMHDTLLAPDTRRGLTAPQLW